MGISSSLNASVAGMSVNASRLATLADNVANSSTNGYKRAFTEFASMVTAAGSDGRTYSAGGVISHSLRSVEIRGALIGTANSTDIAVTGNGMVPVTPLANRDEPALNRPLQLVPTGSFTPDEDGYLTTASGLQLLGWPTTPAGVPTAVGLSRTSPVDLEPVQVTGFDLASDPTTLIELGMNIPAADTSENGTGAAISTGVDYFDSIGTTQTLTMTFTPTTATAGNPLTGLWELVITDTSTGGTVADLDLDFHTTGANAGFLDSVTANTGTYNATTGLLTITTADGTLNIDIGAEDASGNLSQFDSDFQASSVTADGSPVGGLTRVEVRTNGQLEAIYETGYRQIIYQIPVADVTNPNGLTAEDNQAWSISSASGTLYLYDAGTGPVGGMSGYTLEQSNSDIAEEMTELIETQRAYSSNATVVRTVDEMLQETTNLKR